MGYVGYSKSERAVNAEYDGERNASQFNREFMDEINEELGSNIMTLAFAKWLIKEEHVGRSSWHHCSKKYNKVNYYSVESFIEIKDDFPGLLKQFKETKTTRISRFVLTKFDWEKTGRRWHPGKEYDVKLNVEVDNNGKPTKAFGLCDKGNKYRINTNTCIRLAPIKEIIKRRLEYRRRINENRNRVSRTTHT